MELGGAMGAVLNAADEVAVAAHLDGKISFLDISKVILDTFDKLVDCKGAVSLDDIIEADRCARRLAREQIKEI
jgi:1-deoxy-D-xylulose-5-phosphate reductoisomerase